MTHHTDTRLIERARREADGAPSCADGSTCYEWDGGELLTELADRIESLRAEVEHFIDIIDGTETTGFDPHVEQMLMDAAEAARTALGDHQ